MADEDAEPEVGVETFGVLRLPLAARTGRAATWACGASRSRRFGRGKLGYTSRVRGGAVWDPSRSRRKQQLPGRRRWPAAQRRCRARGSRPLAIQVPPFCPVLCDALNHRIFTASGLLVCIVLRAVKRSAGSVPTPDTFPDLDSENASRQHVGERGGGSVPASCAADAFAACAYTPPYMCSVQTARRLLPGQPLPQGVAAFGMAMPVQQPQQ